MELPPNVTFHEDLRLIVYRPRGIFNEREVRAIVSFIEKEEDRAEHPFNRFTDMSKLDAIDLDFQFVFSISLHRRLTYARHPAVKSAFYVTSSAAARIVRIHAIMTDHSPLEVAMFEDMNRAAKWLNVPREKLES